MSWNEVTHLTQPAFPFAPAVLAEEIGDVPVPVAEQDDAGHSGVLGVALHPGPVAGHF